MTESQDKILTEYRHAGFNRRLHMYLQLPQLRSKFILIDQHDLDTNLPDDLKLRRNSLAAQISVALGSAAGGGWAVP